MSLVVLSAHGGPSTAAAAPTAPVSAGAHARGAAVVPATHASATPAAESVGGQAVGAQADSFGITGDVLALMSAAASGVYMVLLPVCVPEETVHMPSLFGKSARPSNPPLPLDEICPYTAKPPPGRACREPRKRSSV